MIPRRGSPAGRRDWRIAWAAALLGLAVSCSGTAGTSEAASPIPLDRAKTPAQLRELLDSIRSRSDPEAALCRARVYSRLRELEPSGSPTLLALGDAADIEVLSRAPAPAVRAESAGRLASHFRERAQNPVLSRSSFPGPLGEPLRRIVLLMIASSYSELASREETAVSLQTLATASLELATRGSLSPDAARIWRKWSAQEQERAAEVRGGSTAMEPSEDARKFSESDLGRHLEDGTRAADLGTREKADRADPEAVLRWYLMALAHFGVVRETSARLTPAQEQALAAQDIVVRSACAIMEP